MEMVATNYRIPGSRILYPHLDEDEMEPGPCASLWLKFIPTSGDNCQGKISESGIYDFVYTWFLAHTWLPLPNSRLPDENKVFSACPEKFRCHPHNKRAGKAVSLVTSRIDKIPMQRIRASKTTSLRHRFVWPQILQVWFLFASV